MSWWLTRGCPSKTSEFSYKVEEEGLWRAQFHLTERSFRPGSI